MKKTFCLTFIVMICSAFFLNVQKLSASTLNILINQIDVNSDESAFKDKDEKESENVQVFMDSLMDYMFNSGLIVSSEKISMEKDVKSAEKIALKSSKEGFFDYLAIIKIKVDAQTDEVLNASWQLKEVSSASEKSSGYLVAKNKKKNMEKDASDFGSEVAKNIYSNASVLKGAF